MTYIVLARKWRPSRFEDVIGQEHITRTLVNAVKEDRIAHAYIFAGPRGVGKTTTARLLSRAANGLYDWEAGGEAAPASAPPQNLDVIEIDGASNRGIDEIRNLRENIRFSPVSSRYKVYIIDEVHMLSKEAFNALLKTLEEPPSHAIFIFATTEIHRVPVTILSRCQRYDFKRIPTQQIAEQMATIARHEKIEIDEDALLAIARKADGSMRDASSILDQMVSFSQGKITRDLVNASLGIISEDVYFQFTDVLLKRENAAVLEFAQNIFQQGHDLMNFIHGMATHFRNLLVTGSTGNTRLIEASDYTKQLYEQNAARFSELDLLHFMEILTQHEERLKFSENPQLMLELLLLKLANKPLSADLQELLALLKRDGGGASGSGSDDGPGSGPKDRSVSPAGGGATAPAKPSASSPSPPSGASSPEGPAAPVMRTPPAETGAAPATNLFANLPSMMPVAAPSPPPVENPAAPAEETPVRAAIRVTLTELRDRWDDVIAGVNHQKKTLASFLQESVPYALDGSTMQLAFDAKNSFHVGHVKANAGMIEKVMAEIYQLPLKFDCIQLDFDAEGIERQVRTPEDMFEDLRKKEPVLQKLIDLFDCEQTDT